MTPTDFATTETEFCVILQHLGPLFLCHTDNISDNISDIKSNKSIIHIFNIHYSILSHRHKVKYVQLSTYHIQYSILSHRYQVNHIHIPYDDGSICVTAHNYAASKTKANQIITKEFTAMHSWNKNFFSHFYNKAAP